LTPKPTYNFGFIKESRYLLFLNVTEQLFFFVVFLVFARKYSVESYGQLITLFTLANVFITLFNLGLPVYLQREVSISNESSSSLLSRVLSLNLIVLVIYLLFTFAYYKIFYGTISFNLYIITVIPAYLYSNINILNSVLSGLKKYKEQFRLLLNSRVITILIFLFFTIYYNSSLKLLVLIYSLGFLYHITLLVFNIIKTGGKISFTFELKGISGLIKISLPLGMAVIFNFLYDKIDILLISKFTDFSQVGYYNIGYGIYKASALAFSFLLVSGLTHISYLSRRKCAVKLFFKKYAISFLFIGIILNIILFFSSDFVIKFIYTDKFANSVFILKIVSFAVTGLALNNLTGVILNGLGLFRENMYVTFTGLIINVILNFIFIPLYGIIAAAVISVITEYFIFYGDYYFIKKFLNPG
jgi:O-antigen/teichoic acid export membrane protein